MSAHRRPLSRLVLPLIYTAAAVGANLIVIVANNLIAPYALLGGVAENLSQLPTWAAIISFATPTTLAMAYFLPVLRYPPPGSSSQEATMPAVVARRILNGPFFSAAIGGIGWAFGGALVLVQIQLSGAANKATLMTLFGIESLLSTLFCFVFVYFSLELINRSFLIPRYFPAGGLSRVEGAISFPAKTRAAILYVAITLYPVFLLFNTSMPALQAFTARNMPLLAATVAALTTAVAWILSQTLARIDHRAFRELRAATDAIRSGVYDIRVSVVSRDELGDLGESVNEMAAGLAEKETLRDAFGKMVDPAVRDLALSGALKLGGELREATVLFCDLRGFTTLSEAIPPQALVQLLNRYFERMSLAIHEQGGMINKYVGDAILAVFGPPGDQPHAASRALRAARAMRRELEALNAELRAEQSGVLDNGIGIHSGMVVAGNIGSSFRMEYTVIGDVVNVASRLESATKRLRVPILLSREALQRLGDEECKLPRLGLIRLKGRKEPIEAFAG
ncbi:MAG: HAMP domain-containing protein [Leptospirales bacterium]|nr:HAMP domain-containing protein [Leptospirales bacterium]